MNIEYPTKHEKKYLLKLIKKQNYFMFLIMKFAFIHPKLHEFISQIFFNLRRLKHIKLNSLSHDPTKIPSFMIIGFPKAGTTSLHEYLSQHPKIFGSWIKETHFFSYGYKKGINFYPKFFEFNNKKDSLYFESSPEYIFYPEALKRIKKFNPDMKLIICLRNPIDLLFSSYNQIKNLGLETENFEKVLLQENFKLELHKKRLKNDIYTLFKRPIYLPYLYIAEYVTYVKNVLEIFDVKNLFFVDSCDLKNHTQKTVDEIFEFLCLDKHTIEVNLHNTSNYQEKISSDSRKKLLDYFESYNAELEKLLNKKFNWN